jgi:hypothetical protein
MRRRRARGLLVAAAACAAALAPARLALAQAGAGPTAAERVPPPWYEGVSPDSGLPRPLPRESAPPPSIPMGRRIDVGVGFAFLAKLADSDAAEEPTNISYEPTVGLEVHLRIPILEQVEVGPYFLVAAHPVSIPDRGLGGVDGAVDTGSVTALCFGARLARTFRIDPVRVWASAGVGYGRMEFGRMVAHESGGNFEIRDRGASFIEFPFGFGGALAVIPKWMSVDLEAAAGPVLNKSGPAWSTFRTIDGAGQVREVGALPEVTATFVTALGVSLIL